MPDHRCGTPAGWWAHKRRSELPCQPCADAFSKSSTAAARTRRAAVARLIDLYPRQWRQILDEETARARLETQEQT